jgi:hypothetical protein
MKAVMLFLILDDEQGEPVPRQTCCGCTEYLEGLGMVRKIGEHVLNEHHLECSMATYVIAGLHVKVVSKHLETVIRDNAPPPAGARGAVGRLDLPVWPPQPGELHRRPVPVSVRVMRRRRNDEHRKKGLGRHRRSPGPDYAVNGMLAQGRAQKTRCENEVWGGAL